MRSCHHRRGLERRRRRLTGLVLAVLACAPLCACGVAPAQKVVLSVASRAPIQRPVTVRASGLVPGSKVVLSASAVDAAGVHWRSNATFVVPGSGAVSAGDRSVGGSWTGRQPMGLFTDMTHAGRPSDQALLTNDRSYTVHLAASVGGRQVASASTERLYPTDLGVTTRRFTMEKDGVYGAYYAPAHPAPHVPAVLLLGGSEGGLSQTFNAETLAADGYPTLTIAYFKEPGLPADFRDIPIEYFERAGRLLEQQPGVTRGHVVIWGISLGSEPAVLAAADDPSVFDGVIAAVPADRVNGTRTDPTASAWTLHGKRLRPPEALGDDPDPAHEPSTFLPASRIRGPLLTICGVIDQVWNSCQHADGLRRERARSRDRSHDVALRYPDAGHIVGWASRYLAITSVDLTGTAGTISSGGTVQRNVLAMATARTGILAFLHGLTKP